MFHTYPSHSLHSESMFSHDPSHHALYNKLRLADVSPFSLDSIQHCRNTYLPSSDSTLPLVDNFEPFICNNYFVQVLKFQKPIVSLIVVMLFSSWLYFILSE